MSRARPVEASTGPRRPAPITAGHPLDALIDRFEAPMVALGELRGSLQQAGCPYAAVYVEGARGAIRHALAVVAKRRDDSANVVPEAADFLALGIGDIAVRLVGGSLVTRGRLLEGSEAMAFTDGEEADIDAAMPEPMLPEDLLADGRIRRLAEGPAFAALLTIALGRHRWVHLETGRTCSLDEPAAACVVAMLNGGRPVRSWPHHFLASLVDAAVSRELLRLGWRRLVTPGLSAASERAACRTMGIDVAEG